MQDLTLTVLTLTVRVLVGRCELGHEIELSIIYVLRIWHAREDR
jgi:hypothetical protein